MTSMNMNLILRTSICDYKPKTSGKGSVDVTMACYDVEYNYLDHKELQSLKLKKYRRKNKEIQHRAITSLFQY